MTNPNGKKSQRPAYLTAIECTGKHRFEDGGLAKQVAQQTSRRKDGRVSAYKCNTCGGWHVGNSRVQKNHKFKE